MANLFAIRQRNLKRFLAFSSISQAGYVMLGVIGGSALGMTSLVYYIWSMAPTCRFFGVSAVEQHTDRKVCIEDYSGFYRTKPQTSRADDPLALLAGRHPALRRLFLSSSSSRPLSGRISSAGFIALLNTVISLYYYLLVVKSHIHHPPANTPSRPSTSDQGTRLSLALCTAGVLLLGIASVVYDSIGAFAFGM